MAKSILITGAGGFIGSFMVEKALLEGYDVWAGVRKTTSKVWLTDKRIHFIELPFGNCDALVSVLNDFRNSGHGRWDFIINNMGVTKCKNRQDFEKVNYQFVNNFISALRTVDMLPNTFVLMSSLSAFGPIHESDGLPISTTDIPYPNTAYGTSKLHAAQLIKSQKDLTWLVFYPTGVYGPREKDYYLMFKTVKAGFDFVPGFKPQRLTFIYVQDLVNCVFMAISKHITNQEFIVAEGNDYSAKDFRKFIQEEMHIKSVMPLTVPLFALKVINHTAGFIAKLAGKASTLNADKFRIIKQRNWTCDISPMIHDIGYTPQYTLKKGIHECCEWYKANGWL